MVEITDHMLLQAYQDIQEEIQKARTYQDFMRASKKQMVSWAKINYDRLGPDVFVAYAEAKRCYLKHKDNLDGT